MKRFARTALLFALFSPVAHASITVSGSSLSWSPLTNLTDYSDVAGDQQTGQASGDLVGSGTNYGFLVGLEDNGSESDTDGEFFFRIRLDDAGWANNNPSFGRVAWVGIDADLNGSIDVFLSANFTGSNAEIGIHAPGDGENISPNTTTIGSAFRTYTPGDGNYNFRPVDISIDGGTTDDLSEDTEGDTDYYVSFMVPFADVVDYLGSKSIGITDQSSLRFLVATSTQDNSLNQDIGGVTGVPDPGTPWDGGGGLTGPGDPAVPEPSSCLLSIVSLTALLLRRRR